LTATAALLGVLSVAATTTALLTGASLRSTLILRERPGWPLAERTSGWGKEGQRERDERDAHRASRATGGRRGDPIHGQGAPRRWRGEVIHDGAVERRQRR